MYQHLSGARAALAELKGRSPVIPNSKMLINTLVLQEAKDSSSIENIFTSTDKLYKAVSASSVEPDPQTKEVLRYRFALWDAWKNMVKAELSIQVIENIYRKIKEKKQMESGIRRFILATVQKLFTLRHVAARFSPIN